MDIATKNYIDILDRRSIADAINVLGQFCGMRDVDCLNRTSLLAKYKNKVDYKS